MKDLPSPFWVTLYIAMAVILSIVALVRPNVANVTMAVIAIASNIVSGSFGYISGHATGFAAGVASVEPPPLTPNPTLPETPAPPKEG